QATAPRTPDRRPQLHPHARRGRAQARAQGPSQGHRAALARPGQRRRRAGDGAAGLARAVMHGGAKRAAQGDGSFFQAAIEPLRRHPSDIAARGRKLAPPVASREDEGSPPPPPGVPMHALTGQRAGFQPHPAPAAPAAKTPSNILADEHTGLQQVLVSRHPHFGNQLFLDEDLQISESDTAYGVAMTSPLLELERPARVAILGGGDGGVLNELLRTFEPLDAVPSELTMVDIDRRVIDLSRRHLPALCGDAFDSPHANVVVGDAFAWIARARDLDAVIYDLTMDPVREGQDRAGFISGIVAHMARALRPGGVLSMQCCGHGLRDADDRATRRELLPLIREAVDSHF